MDATFLFISTASTPRPAKTVPRYDSLFCYIKGLKYEAAFKAIKKEEAKILQEVAANEYKNHCQTLRTLSGPALWFLLLEGGTST